ncbi:MAG TPA: GxxExxY protein [Longimicrobiales bacterium]|nr:GxxExxY protein [Longimicrobiales bacterium]
MQELDAITAAIIGDAIAIHRELGPGLLEATYEACLTSLWSRHGLEVERLINFNVTRLTDGLRRVVPGYRAPLSSFAEPSASSAIDSVGGG